MLRCLLGEASDRKLRLAACAYSRLEAGDLLGPVARRPLEVAERLADGSAGDGERDDAYRAACDAYEEAYYEGDTDTKIWLVGVRFAALPQAGGWLEWL